PYTTAFRSRACRTGARWDGRPVAQRRAGVPRVLSRGPFHGTGRRRSDAALRAGAAHRRSPGLLLLLRRRAPAHAPGQARRADRPQGDEDSHKRPHRSRRRSHVVSASERLMATAELQRTRPTPAPVAAPRAALGLGATGPVG